MVLIWLFSSFHAQQCKTSPVCQLICSRHWRLPVLIWNFVLRLDGEQKWAQHQKQRVSYQYSFLIFKWDDKISHGLGRNERENWRWWSMTSQSLVMSAAIFNTSVLWQLRKTRLLPLLLWNNHFSFAPYRLQPATAGIQQPCQRPLK